MTTDLTDDRREQICAWLRANGVDPDRVPRDSDLYIETDDNAQGYLHFEHYDVDAFGKKVLNERGDSAARRAADVPLVVEPPEWWTPHTKPTREQLLGQLTAVYRERAHLVAHLASLYPATMADDPADPDWRIVYLDTPAGQWSWHISHDDLDLFSHVPDGTAEWDGHTTDEKYQRMRELTAAVMERCGSECSEAHTYTGRCEARSGARKDPDTGADVQP